MVARVPRALCLLALLLPIGCGQELLPTGRAELTTGQEKNTWTKAPAPVRVAVDKFLPSGDKVPITSGAAPLGSFSLGTGSAGYFRVTARDVQRVARVEGWSVEIDPAAVAAHKVPLFVQRSDAFARPPGLLGTAQGASPPAAVFGSRHLLLGGAAQSSQVVLDGYDLGLWTPDATTTAIACPAKKACHFRSLAVVGSVALGVGDDWAVWFDLDAGTTGSAPLPDGLSSYADIAGGQTVAAPDGSTYIVGATRSDPPSASVLRINADKTLTALSLVTPRAGASAAWVQGRGLVVAGGSAQGAGVELAASDATAFEALGYPADPTTGAGLAVLDGSTLLRVGGRDPQGNPAQTVRLALGCNNSCTAEARGTPVPLDNARAFHFDPGDVLVVGDDDGGMTGAVRITGATRTPIALREPRSHATALLAPTGQVAVVGGLLADGTPARSVELYLP